MDTETTLPVSGAEDGEVLKLLVCSLVSKMPLTETLLKHEPFPELSNENVDQEIDVESRMLGDATNEGWGGMQDNSMKGCIGQLYKTVQDLDEQCLKSNNDKKMLEEASTIKAAGKAWYQTMISDSDYTEFDNFTKWLGVSQ
ncbi:hypothetical protein Pyn_22392 [Prunus yedoensis var. nudiflora]|uniref:Uncharacterized protein n=1 Tax=Prunus yedoensis var. nudiflora TaxID=2094558 RepID=A0A314UJP8_PRUYE|nr:hypothetical protein Pyn_22392 [Prunus yedoensis var. nudiflora]